MANHAGKLSAISFSEKYKSIRGVILLYMPKFSVCATCGYTWCQFVTGEFHILYFRLYKLAIIGNHLYRCAQTGGINELLTRSSEKDIEQDKTESQPTKNH
ncbi:hypothetical protein ABID22_000254 [Pontibacter aydingkolensis]|uniref:Uncharacterized protein n=1 Tax=Pontibacter aydingkolensis TaxID=1911536 RepID=A0ABS7CQJ7_9BACT|nr:hypothetical protein [Pontibacter aydingkolensis]MBW7466080.1 hypothetical protein [Pontibacter aydingkolensis]